MTGIEIALLVLAVLGPVAAYFAAKSKNTIDDKLVEVVLPIVKTELEKHRDAEHKG